MGRYRGPVVKLCRREGVNLIETPKVQRYMEAHPYPPGQHGQRRRRKPSDYGVRLREKQKLRIYYNMSEKTPDAKMPLRLAKGCMESTVSRIAGIIGSPHEPNRLANRLIDEQPS